MRRVWIAQDRWELGGIGTSWLQRLGVSRSARTGAWTLYDRRDARLNGEGLSTAIAHCPDTQALIDAMEDEHDLAWVLEGVERWAEPDLVELAVALRARLRPRARE